MSRRVSRAARRAEETASLAYAQRVGLRHVALDVPRTVSKVGEHGPYTPAPVVAPDAVQEAIRAIHARRDEQLAALDAQELPFREDLPIRQQIIRDASDAIRVAMSGGAS